MTTDAFFKSIAAAITPSAWMPRYTQVRGSKLAAVKPRTLQPLAPNGGKIDIAWSEAIFKL